MAQIRASVPETIAPSGIIQNALAHGTAQEGTGKRRTRMFLESRSDAMAIWKRVRPHYMLPDPDAARPVFVRIPKATPAALV